MRCSIPHTVNLLVCTSYNGLLIYDMCTCWLICKTRRHSTFLKVFMALWVHLIFIMPLAGVLVGKRKWLWLSRGEIVLLSVIYLPLYFSLSGKKCETVHPLRMGRSLSYRDPGRGRPGSGARLVFAFYLSCTQGELSPVQSCLVSEGLWNGENTNAWLSVRNARVLCKQWMMVGRCKHWPSYTHLLVGRCDVFVISGG